MLLGSSWRMKMVWIGGDDRRQDEDGMGWDMDVWKKGNDEK